MHRLPLACSAAVAVVLLGPPVYAAPAPAIAAAVADPQRPAQDTARDANRKPAETLAFADLKPGDRVADFLANSGYFTRLFADVVGPKGHVYAVELDEVVAFANVAKGYAGLKDWAAGRSNVSIDTVPAAKPLSFAKPLDMFWISQNYHDLSDKFLGPLDVAAFNRQVYAALKPGGLYVILDHAALPGAPADVTETLHRIDKARVLREVTAAGFRFVGESRLLANPADSHTVGVFDPSIAGHTDQFILKFRRPG